MARLPIRISRKLSFPSRRSKDMSDKDQDFITQYPSEKNKPDKMLAARFSFTDTPEQSLDSILDSYADYDYKTDAPTLEDEAWASRERDTSCSSTSRRSRKSISPSRRKSIITITSKRRSLCDMMCEAASIGDVPQIGRLLGAGADPKRKSRDGLYPVHLAAAGGHLGVLKSLAMHGARMDTRDQLGRTPIHAAALGRQGNVIPFLVNSGVPVDAKDVNGFTALQLATQMEADHTPEEFDIENEQINKVRFSYMFGASKAAKRSSVSSTLSTHYTPLEALRRAGAESRDLRVEARL